MMAKALVSVIIPTKNSQEYIKKCLDSISHQTYPNIEIIVVDNNSKDKTKEIAKKYTDKVFNKGPERSSQRNYGASVSTGVYLYFVDSDFYLEERVIEEAVKKAEEGCEIIAIHNSSDPCVSIWSKVRKFERDMYKYDFNNIAVRFIKKSAFLDVGGYNEELIASEDYDLHNRLVEKGYKLGFIEPEEIHLGEPKSLLEIYKKHYYYGKSINQYIKTNKKYAAKQLSPIRPAFIKNAGKFLKKPLMTFLFLIYNFVKYFAAFNGMVVSIFTKKEEGII
jgi:glycosyltransferase involved in cell wall biosynthesis